MLPNSWVCPYLTRNWVKTIQHFLCLNPILGQIWTNPSIGKCIWKM